MYFPSLGYIALAKYLAAKTPPWWGKTLWKQIFLTKVKLFMWLLLQNKVPTRKPPEKKFCWT
jgi:hypothetical protein